MNKTVVLNAGKVNYDGTIDFSHRSEQVTIYEGTAPQQILGRVEGYNIVVTKEIPVSGELLCQFPPSVQLICEDGIGGSSKFHTASAGGPHRSERKNSGCNWRWTHWQSGDSGGPGFGYEDSGLQPHTPSR